MSSEPGQTIGRRDRPLYRDTSDKMVAGVCSGLAQYFDIHTTLVRVAFVVLTLLSGAGVLAYVILWIVLGPNPEYLPPGSFTIIAPSRIEVEPEFPQATHPDFRVEIKVEYGGPVHVMTSGACSTPSELGPNYYLLTVADVGTCTITAVQDGTNRFSSSVKHHNIEVVRS